MVALYLAGPEVFLPDAAEIGAAKTALCRAYGFAGLFPLDEPLEAHGAPREHARAIYRSCRTMIARADAIIANLTPFRSISADPGTVFELGVFAGAGKPLFAYSNVAEDLLGRTRRALPSVRFDPTRDHWVDGSGAEIEDFGNADNLMLDMALAESAAPIVRADGAVLDPARDLSAFERCLAVARDRFSS